METVEALEPKRNNYIGKTLSTVTPRVLITVIAAKVLYSHMEICLVSLWQLTCGGICQIDQLRSKYF